MPAMATIWRREGRIGKTPWRQYGVIEDGRETVVDMEPAPYGCWNFGRVTVHAGDAWPGMNEAAIVAWRRDWDDGLTTWPDLPSDSGFRARLLRHVTTHHTEAQ